MHYARCSECKKKKINPDELTSTHDGNLICWDCAEELGMCEICGSLPPKGNADQQIHYDELCFK